MTDELSSRLAAYLEERDRRARVLTSGTRVEARVTERIAGRAPGAPRLRHASALALTLVTAAVLAVVVGGSLALRLHGSTSSPAPAPSSEPIPPGPPPVGTPVFYVPGHADPSTLIAFDWEGEKVGSVHLPPQADGLPATFEANLDGSRLIVGSASGNRRTVMTTAAQPLFDLPVDDEPRGQTGQPQFPAAWGDDGRTICLTRGVMENAGGQRTLSVIDGSGRERVVGDLVPPGAPPGLRWSVAGCSPTRGVAVVAGYEVEPDTITTQSQAASTSSAGGIAGASVSMGATIHRGAQWLVMVRVIRLSDGSEVSRHTYPGGSVVTGLVSPDCTLLLEAAGAGTSTVRDLRTDAVVGSGPWQNVAGFADHDTSLVTHTITVVNGTQETDEFRLVNIASGVTRWTTHVGTTYGAGVMGIRVEADGQRMAFGLPVGEPECNSAWNLLLVDEAGLVRTIASDLDECR